MGKHTRGPWIVRDHPTETCQVISEPTSIRVADVWCTDLEGGAENALLIASAPDLLAAAMQTLDDLENMSSEDFSLGADAGSRNLLRSAIAKARGEAE